MNGIVVLVGGFLLLLISKMIWSRNWLGVVLCILVSYFLFGTSIHIK